MGWRRDRGNTAKDPPTSNAQPAVPKATQLSYLLSSSRHQWARLPWRRFPAASPSAGTTSRPRAKHVPGPPAPKRGPDASRRGTPRASGGAPRATTGGAAARKRCQRGRTPECGRCGGGGGLVGWWVVEGVGRRSLTDRSLSPVARLSHRGCRHVRKASRRPLLAYL